MSLGQIDPWQRIRAKRWQAAGAMVIQFPVIGAIEYLLSPVSRALAHSLESAIAIGVFGLWVYLNQTSVCPNCERAYGNRWPVMNGPFGVRCRWCRIKFGKALEVETTSDRTDAMTSIDPKDLKQPPYR